MQLREYQRIAVTEGLKKLQEKGNTLLVLPTGGGKTICLSYLISDFIKNGHGSKVLVLQHRKEIIWQNMQKFNKVDPSLSMSLISQDSKDNTGSVVFAMVQTLHKNPELICHFDLIVIDEAHHAMARSYLNIIERSSEINKNLKLYGVTATPIRGDKQRLKSIFNNISYSVSIQELVASGVLVPPKAYVLDIGLSDELDKRTNGDRKLSDLLIDNISSDIIQSSKVDTGKAFNYWQELAGDRKTVVFTPKIIDSIKIMNVFADNGVKAALITHDTPKSQREEILKNFEHGDTQILFNTSILTEGWDCPIASCITLFKSSSQKSTYIQIVGRGLRSYPNKKDCLVIDFGFSTQIHGSLEQDIQKAIQGVSPTGGGSIITKICPECYGEIPGALKVCYLCGHEFKSKEEKEQTIKEFKLKEFELIKQIEEKLNYRFCEINKNNFIASVGASAFVWVSNRADKWYVLSNLDSEGTELCGVFETKSEAYDCSYKKIRSSSGKDEFLKKNNSWLDYPPTDKQLALLKNIKTPSTRYDATCHITYKFKLREVTGVINYATNF